MEQDQIWSDFLALPPSAQQQVVDFIAFLRARHTQMRPPEQRDPGNLADEPFVGMWGNRSEMADSTGWVRSLRETEW